VHTHGISIPNLCGFLVKPPLHSEILVTLLNWVYNHMILILLLLFYTLSCSPHSQNCGFVTVSGIQKSTRFAPTEHMNRPLLLWLFATNLMYILLVRLIAVNDLGPQCLIPSVKFVLPTRDTINASDSQKELYTENRTPGKRI